MVHAKLPSLPLMLVTDRRTLRGGSLVTAVEVALRGGVNVVQLREKDLGGRELLALACSLRSLCHRYGARLLVNDRIDVALACGADGVQLPRDSFSPADARRLLGPGRLVGASTHSLAEVEAAVQGGADFVVFGPVFATPAKQRYGAPVGLDALRDVVQAAAVPVVAIGGITPANAGSVAACGAAGLAAIAALLAEVDPASAARALRTSFATHASVTLASVTPESAG